MGTFFKIVGWIFGILYAVAFAVAVIGWFGLFGVAHDPLAVVFLIPLGLPWNFVGDYFPVGIQPYISMLAPLINLAILNWLSKFFYRRA